jgi:hypothetical protein
VLNNLLLNMTPCNCLFDITNIYSKINSISNPRISRKKINIAIFVTAVTQKNNQNNQTIAITISDIYGKVVLNNKV